MVWGEILFFKREKKAGGEGGSKEKLLKVEYGFGYGLTLDSWTFNAFFLFC